MTAIKKVAMDLAALLRQIEDIKLEAKALVEMAEENGIDPKALRKVAREMVMEHEKRLKKYDEEAQLEMFRAEVGLTLHPSQLAEAAE